jgi:putative FmdB family regulatory protein
MPIYEYACSSCGFEKDYLQKMSDPLLTDCPQCHQPSLQKKLSAPSFQLKGSGWYATDFKGGSSGTTSVPSSTSSSAASAASADSTSAAAQTTASSSSDTTSSAATSHSCGQGACGKCA